MKLAHKLLALTSISLSCSTLVQAQDLYLIIGQSNAAGRGELPVNPVALTGVQVLQGDSTFVPAFPNLNIHSSVRNTRQLAGFNLGYTFAERMRAANGNNIQLVVNARGGSAIRHWFPGFIDDADPLSYFDEAVRRLRAARTANPNAIFRGILWHQGESNRFADDYIGDITAFIALLRTEIGNVPFVAGQLARDREDSEPFNTNLLQLPSRVSNTAVVTSEGLATSDRTHYTAAASQTLGERYAEQMLILLAPSFDYTSWASLFPNIDLSELTADLDGDGIDNNSERIWGLNPNDAGSSNPYLSLPDTNRQFSYTRRNPLLSSLNYVIETSTDLITWNVDANAIQRITNTNASSIQTVSVSISTIPTNGKLFTRVVANTP